ncbi:MAG: type II secretion system F family protein [Pseudomonadota bacterium]
MAPLIIATAFALGTLCLGLMAASWLSQSSDTFSSHLAAEPTQREQSAKVIHALGTAFGPIAVPFTSITATLDKQLTHAGRPYGGVSGQQYLAAAIVLSLVIGAVLGAVFGLNAMLNGNPVLATALRWWLGTAGGVVIFLVADVKSNAKRHSDALEREFPFFLDLAVLVVQAGGTPRKALAKYVEASPGTPLSNEIAITAKDADSSSFDAALHRMIDRVQPTSVKTILKNLAQGEKTSGEAEQFYTDQAEELRYLREEMASRAAERLKTNIVMPVFLMLMSIILAALAPTIVSIRSQGFF